MTWHQCVGHKGLVLRSRFNGTKRAQTQSLLYTLLVLMGSSSLPCWSALGFFCWSVRLSPDTPCPLQLLPLVQNSSSVWRWSRTCVVICWLQSCCVCYVHCSSCFFRKLQISKNNCLVKEVIEIQLHPVNYNRDGAFMLSRTRQLLLQQVWNISIENWDQIQQYLTLVPTAKKNSYYHKHSNCRDCLHSATV
jgi:hypothetical protein